MRVSAKFDRCVPVWLELDDHDGDVDDQALEAMSHGDCLVTLHDESGNLLWEAPEPEPMPYDDALAFRCEENERMEEAWRLKR